MKRTKIKELWTNAAAFDGAHITVCGWARTIRDMKNFGFLELNDGSSFKGVQVVLEREKVANYDEIVRQNVGAAFIAEGTLVLTPDAPQPFELKAETVTVEGVSSPDYPLQKKRHSVEYLRTIQHLRPRTNLFSAADCLVPGIGEIIGGSQREERLDLLAARMAELGLNEEDYWWYLDLRRYGSCRHAGFGLGFERMVMYLTGISNIRDVELHPRTVGNADF